MIEFPTTKRQRSISKDKQNYKGNSKKNKEGKRTATKLPDVSLKK